MSFICRSCDSQNTHSIIPLGNLPLANALLAHKTHTHEPRHNLEVMLCENCGLAQLKDIINPDDLFSDYVYFSSNSTTMLESVSQLVDRVIPSLEKDSLVIEIASNDGYLLKNYVRQNIHVLGIDPAKNIADVANQKGIPTLCDFFGQKLASKLAKDGKQADIIHANNVMAHVPDINGFIQGIKLLLKPHGQAIIEVPYWADLVEKLEFDTIYHEHVYYFSLKALKAAFEKQNLEIVNLEKLPIHGGSLRLFIMHGGAQEPENIIDEMIQYEEGKEVHQASTFANFMQRLSALKKELTQTLRDLKASGANIAAYGASAKGTTLLNFFEIDSKLIDFVVDRSPAKQGKFTPGTQLEIFSPEKLQKSPVTHALLLSWNFAKEIIEQQAEFVSQGGKFIIPLPTVKILPEESL